MITRTRLPGGVRNSSVLQLGTGTIFSTGDVWYVSSVTGNTGNIGKDPAFPLATLQQAVSSATANNGDIIVLMPGHAETVTATSVNISKAGLQIIGVGTGLKRPIFTFGAAAATITFSAANCSIGNVDCLANFADVAAAFTLGAAKDTTIEGCTFRDTDSTHNFLSCVVTGAVDNDADGLRFVGNDIHSLPTTDGAVVSILAAEKRVVIADNFANKAATNNAGHFITLSTKILTGAQILRNSLIVVGATTATVGIFLTGSGSTSTGIVAYNLCASLDTTTELMFTASTGLKFFENYYTGTADASGYLVPAADSAA